MATVNGYISRGNNGDTGAMTGHRHSPAGTEAKTHGGLMAALNFHAISFIPAQPMPRLPEQDAFECYCVYFDGETILSKEGHA